MHTHSRNPTLACPVLSGVPDCSECRGAGSNLSKQTDEKRRGAKRETQGHLYLAQGTEGAPAEETEAPAIETKRKPNHVSSQKTGETGMISSAKPSESLAG